MIDYRDTPLALVVGDSPGARAHAAVLVERAGFRIAALLDLPDAVERIDRQATLDAVIVEAATASADLDRLLDRLQSAASRGEWPSIVAAPPALIDAVVARAPHPLVEQIVGDSEAERMIALARAAVPRPARLHDLNRREGTAVLHQLSEEVARIAHVLASLSDEERGGNGVVAGEARDEPATDPAYVRTIIRARRLRDQYFRGELFADPAFDMLLDLYAARLEQTRVAVSSLCIAAAVPATTALRWIKALTDRGLFVRSADPRDGRRVYIELSDEAARAMGNYLAAVQRVSPVVI